jgi:hypothetical protein
VDGEVEQLVAGPSSGLAALSAAMSSKTRPVEREITRGSPNDLKYTHSVDCTCT